MNQNQRIPQNNSSVAWFKIAHLIERREREKALSVYRLMVHSLQDRAYALQLEGDILWSFDDTRDACQKYFQAAFLYRNAKRWLNAVSLYEHILLLDSEHYESLIASIPCYAQLGWGDKFTVCLTQLKTVVLDNLSGESLITNLIKNLAEFGREIDDLNFRLQLQECLQQLLVNLPHPVAEKLEPVVKKCF